MTIGLLVDEFFGKAHETLYKPFSWAGNGLVFLTFKKRLLCTFAFV